MPSLQKPTALSHRRLGRSLSQKDISKNGYSVRVFHLLSLSWLVTCTWLLFVGEFWNIKQNLTDGESWWLSKQTCDLHDTFIGYSLLMFTKNTHSTQIGLSLGTELILTWCFWIYQSQSSVLTDDEAKETCSGKNTIEKTIRAVYAQKKVGWFPYWWIITQWEVSQ